MDSSEVSPITELLRLSQRGDSEAEQRLFRALFVELRKIAAAKMRCERTDHTLQPTALVNEAYVRLTSNRDREYEDRAHFLAVASQMMHRVLVDHARAKNAGKRQGKLWRVDLSEAIPSNFSWSDDMLDFEMCLDRLAQFEPVGARVVEMRVFSGMTNDEIARVISKSTRMVKRYNRNATVWLLSELSKISKEKRPEQNVSARAAGMGQGLA